MKIGSRWALGAEPPATLSNDLRRAIAEEEAELAGLGLTAGSDAAAEWAWTLTFLEGAPVVELTDGTVIREHEAGILVTRED